MKTTSHAPSPHAGGGALWFYYGAENQLSQVTSNNVTGFITQWQTFLAYDGRQRLRLRIERAHLSLLKSAPTSSGGTPRAARSGASEHPARPIPSARRGRAGRSATSTTCKELRCAAYETQVRLRLPGSVERDYVQSFT